MNTSALELCAGWLEAFGSGVKARSPRLDARAKRKALTDVLPSKFATVEEQFAQLDDLIIQFRGTEAGDRFVAAWFNARRVVDTGRRANKPAPAPAPAPTH